MAKSKRPTPKKHDKPDFTEVAFRVFQKAIGESVAPPTAPISRRGIAGRKGGLKGGIARAARLTKEERSEIARRAAKARWKR